MKNIPHLALLALASLTLGGCASRPAVMADIDRHEAEQSSRPPVRGIPNMGERSYIRAAAEIDGYGPRHHHYRGGHYGPERRRRFWPW